LGAQLKQGLGVGSSAKRVRMIRMQSSLRCEAIPDRLSSLYGPGSVLEEGKIERKKIMGMVERRKNPRKSRMRKIFGSSAKRVRMIRMQSSLRCEAIPDRLSSLYGAGHRAASPNQNSAPGSVLEEGKIERKKIMGMVERRKNPRMQSSLRCEAIPDRLSSLYGAGHRAA
jgi:hypothetical protein